MIVVKLIGNTYGIKNVLKSNGFKWDGKAWVQTFEDVELDRADELAHRWNSEGVYGTLTIVKG